LKSLFYFTFDYTLFKPLFPRSEERDVGRSLDRVSLTLVGLRRSHLVPPGVILTVDFFDYVEFVDGKRCCMAANTHPVYASLDHPLFCCAGKRGLESLFYFTFDYTLFKPLFPRSEERDVGRSLDRVSLTLVGLCRSHLVPPGVIFDR
jgi:hypothetical protein